MRSILDRNSIIKFPKRHLNQTSSINKRRFKVIEPNLKVSEEVIPLLKMRYEWMHLQIIHLADHRMTRFNENDNFHQSTNESEDLNGLPTFLIGYVLEHLDIGHGRSIPYLGHIR